MVIDFHTHTFPEKISEKAVSKLRKLSRTQAFTNGSVTELLDSMAQSSVDYSVNLPVMTSPGQVEKINNSLISQREELLNQGIITFGGMHPDYSDYKKELRRLKQAGIPGIKIHPAYQSVDLDDIRMMHIIDCASELGLIVITHAGIDIGIYDHNYASVPHILHVLDEVHPDRLVLAHMGNWACWNDVEKDLAGADVWLDTAFSIGTITPDPEQDTEPIRNTNLSDAAFVRLCRKHGTDKILFATDSPWEQQDDYITRIQNTNLTDSEKEQILSGNAKKLLEL